MAHSTVMTDERIPYVQWIRRYRARQKAPYRDPLPYYVHTQRTLSATPYGVFRPGQTAYPSFMRASDPNNSTSPVQSFAYRYYQTMTEVKDAIRFATESFNSQVNDSAEALVNSLEYESALQSVIKRTGQVRRFAKALRKLDFRTCADELGFSKAQRRRYQVQYPSAWDKGKAASRSFADNFLEWHFGWSPLIKDIHRSCEILTSDPPRQISVIGKGRSDWSWSYLDTSHGRRYSGVHAGYCRAKVFARISVENPNSYLASQLGLLNPLSVGWELIPFSWVVDYFLNVSDVLKQLNAHVGLSLTDQQWTYQSFDACTGSYFNSHLNPVDGWVIKTTGSIFERVIGPPPAIALGLRKKWVNPFSGSPWRAASVVAVLAQQLKH